MAWCVKAKSAKNFVQNLNYARHCARNIPAIFSAQVRFSSDQSQKIMAIRRETVNVWERRAPLSPLQVRKLVKSGVKVIVQPSDRRAYSMKVGIGHVSAFFLS